MSDAFIPFDATLEEVEQRGVLRGGVPATMRPLLVKWLLGRHPRTSIYPRAQRFHEISNELDIDFGVSSLNLGHMNETAAIQVYASLTERDLLRVVDFCLHEAGRQHGVASQVEKILKSGRSKWTPVLREDRYRLGERVPDGVQVSAESVMGSAGVAGSLVRQAWEKVHDLESDDSGAYSRAVKAVETAALEALDITKDTATLSDAIRAIEARDSTWRLPFQREHTEYPSKDVLLGLMKSLYRGQRDRHGSDSYADVTHEEAEAAVLMAVTLVGLFSAGLVAERDTEAFR